jgi:hypothetical protein
MTLAPGSRMAIEFEPLERGRVRVTLRVRVGNTGSRDLAPPKVCASMAEAWAEVELLAQERLAQIGLEAIRERHAR